MIDNPLVSIIIPVYNGSNYLSEAIESALAQTYRNIEIIVVNDGSNDDGKTEALALSYGDKIRYIKKFNGGVSSALNLGISQMTGEYFSWLSHDDKYTESKIERQISLLKKYEDRRVIALCGSRFIDKNSEIMARRSNDRFTTEYNDWKDALENLFSQGTYNGCAFLVPKQIFDECGMFDEELRFAQDTLMWARMFLSKYSVVYDAQVGSLSRIHEAQQTHKSRHLLRHDSKKIAEYILPSLVEENQQKSLYLFAKRNAKLSNEEAVYFCIDNGKIKGLRCLMLKAFLLYGKVRPIFRDIYYKYIVRL